MKLSDKSDTHRKTKHLYVQPCHPPSDARDMLAPLTDRRKQNQLRDLINDLHARGYDYRTIASHTWRGESRFGRFQRYAKGDHLTGGLVAIHLDLHDVIMFTRVLKKTENQRQALKDLALAALSALVLLSRAVLNLLDEASK